jgi:hypothetical protein
MQSRIRYNGRIQLIVSAHCHITLHSTRCALDIFGVGDFTNVCGWGLALGDQPHLKPRQRQSCVYRLSFATQRLVTVINPA